MAVETQTVYDNGQTALVKVVGYFTGATTSNTLIVTANTLSYANVSQTCLLDIDKIDFTSKLNSGFAQLVFVGSSANTAAVAISNGTGTLPGMQNNATSPLGDLGLFVYKAADGDSFTMYVTLRKRSGFSSAYTPYNNL